MAKKPGTPAWKAGRVWQAIKAGSLKDVRPIPGTRILWVGEGRLRLTWTEDGVKKHTQIRVRRRYLHPRWIPLADETLLAQIASLSKEGLAAQGILRLDGNDYRILIYQQLDDMFSLQRQIEKHILPRYEEEQEKLWGTLEQIKKPGTELEQLIFGRLDQIVAIRPHMAGRAEAVRLRIESIRKRQAHIKDALLMLLEQAPLGERGEPLEGRYLKGAVRGIVDSLAHHHKDLAVIATDVALARDTRWAQFYLERAIAKLCLQELGAAREHLQKAVSRLQWKATAK